MKVLFTTIGVFLLAAFLFTLLFISLENGARDRDCFHAGGKVIDGVCMPVENSIKLPREKIGN